MPLGHISFMSCDITCCAVEVVCPFLKLLVLTWKLEPSTLFLNTWQLISIWSQGVSCHITCCVVEVVCLFFKCLVFDTATLNLVHLLLVNTWQLIFMWCQGVSCLITCCAVDVVCPFLEFPVFNMATWTFLKCLTICTFFMKLMCLVAPISCWTVLGGWVFLWSASFATFKWANMARRFC